MNVIPSRDRGINGAGVPVYAAKALDGALLYKLLLGLRGVASPPRGPC
jgi:hypothetical protein